MKVVRADWEQRNLGVITYEITADSGDDVADIECALSKCPDAEYTVIKVSSDNCAIANYVRKNGFDFIEATADLNLKTDSFISNSRIKKITDRCRYEQMEESDLEFLFDQGELLMGWLDGLNDEQRAAV